MLNGGRIRPRVGGGKIAGIAPAQRLELPLGPGQPCYNTSQLPPAETAERIATWINQHFQPLG